MRRYEVDYTGSCEYGYEPSDSITVEKYQHKGTRVCLQTKHTFI
jgi:hypothetical protein